MCFGLSETLSAFSQQSPDPPRGRQTDQQRQAAMVLCCKTPPRALSQGSPQEMSPQPAFVASSGQGEEEMLLLRLRGLVKAKCLGYKVFVEKMEVASCCSVWFRALDLQSCPVLQELNAPGNMNTTKTTVNRYSPAALLTAAAFQAGPSP